MYQLFYCWSSVFSISHFCLSFSNSLFFYFKKLDKYRISLKIFQLVMEPRENWICHYFQRGYTYEEIVGLLRNHNINISVRHLKRLLRNLGLRRKGIIGSDLEEVCSAIISKLDSSGSDLGYKALWRRLKLFHGLTVKRDRVLDILRIVDPDGLDEQLQHRLRRRKYCVPGPNF